MDTKHWNVFKLSAPVFCTVLQQYNTHHRSVYLCLFACFLRSNDSSWTRLLWILQHVGDPVRCVHKCGEVNKYSGVRRGSCHAPLRHYITGTRPRGAVHSIRAPAALSQPNYHHSPRSRRYLQANIQSVTGHTCPPAGLPGCSDGPR